MGAGAFVFGAILLLRDDTNNQKVVNVTFWSATLCLIVGLLLLLSELIDPLRGMLLWQSFSNFSSWMTIGAWVVLSAVMVFAATALLTTGALRDRIVGSSPRKTKGIRTATKALAIVGIVCGIGVAIYTGILLMWVPGIPLWGTFLLPCLFSISALDTGVALVEVIALASQRKSPLTGKARALLEKAVVILVLGEGAVLACFIGVMLGGNAVSAQGSASYSATAVASIKLLLTGELAPFFWGLFVACGLAIPLVAAVAGLIGHKKAPGPAMALGAVAALVGGATLRFVILLAGAHVDYVADTVMRLIL
jgi:formate-dependent nitrite reductase membrane component NrfD